MISKVIVLPSAAGILCSRPAVALSKKGPDIMVFDLYMEAATTILNKTIDNGEAPHQGSF